MSLTKSSGKIPCARRSHTELVPVAKSASIRVGGEEGRYSNFSENGERSCSGHSGVSLTVCRRDIGWVNRRNDWE